MVDWNAVVNWILAIAGVIGAAGAILAVLQKVLSSAMKKELSGTNIKIDLMRGEVKSISEKVDRVEYEERKNFLVSVLRDLSDGSELDSATRARFYENYDAYVAAGGNSYIKEEVERARKDGKL